MDDKVLLGSRGRGHLLHGDAREVGGRAEAVREQAHSARHCEFTELLFFNLDFSGNF